MLPTYLYATFMYLIYPIETRGTAGVFGRPCLYAWTGNAIFSLANLLPVKGPSGLRL